MQSKPRLIAISTALLCAVSMVGAESGTAHAPAAIARRVSAPVDINRATVDDLLKLPGMTRVWAERIVRFRPYHSKRDLAELGILPGNLYSKIKDYIVAHRVK